MKGDMFDRFRVSAKNNDARRANGIDHFGIGFPELSTSTKDEYSLATPNHSPSGLKATSLTGRVHRVSNRTLSALFCIRNRLTVQSSEAEANAFLDAAIAVTGSVCCSNVSGSFDSSSTVNLRMS